MYFVSSRRWYYITTLVSWSGDHTSMISITLRVPLVCAGSFTVTTFPVTYQYTVDMLRSSVEDVATHCQTTRCGTFWDSFTWPLAVFSYFFFYLPAKAYLDKYRSRLLAEIEQHLSQNSWSSVNNFKTHIILDLMSKLRQMQLSNCRIIGGVIRQVIASAKHACENELLHVKLDFYSEMSLKESNQLWRSNITPIDLFSMTETVPTPLQLDTFWASIQTSSN